MSENKKLNTFVGQRGEVSFIKKHLSAVKKNNTAFPHTVIYGGPGLGKTTMAEIIANELNYPIMTLLGGNLQTEQDLAWLVQLRANHVVFIDEIHAMSMAVTEKLYLLMENFRWITRDGHKVKVPDFTVIGATTNLDMLSKPLRDRFKVQLSFQPYELSDLIELADQEITRINMTVPKSVVKELALKSRGVPRLLKSLIFNMHTLYGDSIKQSDVPNLFRQLGINTCGLNKAEVAYMRVLKRVASVSPVGIKSLAKVLGENSAYVDNYLEPYLLSEGFVTITSRGRMWSGKEFE